MNLHELGLRCGSGKPAHNYLGYFQQYLEPIRESLQSMLEIGIDSGGSIRMWEQYFPNAIIYGIDSQPECMRSFERAKPLLADQGNRDSLLSVVGHLRFDLIVDDGGHRMEQQITSFTTLWPLLNVGGHYIIEDLHTSYQPNYGSPPTTMDYLKQLLDTLHYRGKLQYSKSISSEELGRLSELEKHLEFIHFYPYLAVIKKWWLPDNITPK